MPELHFRVLGPLEVVRDGQQVTISAPKLRVLLAALLLRANTTVTVEKLGERLWGDSPPPTVRKSTQLYALRLRRMLGDGEGSPIETRPDGYLIRLTPDQLDLLRFQQSVAAAKEAGDLATELARLDEALACWRGPALGDVPSESLQRDEVASLSEELLRAQERRMQISLELGRHREIIGDLVGLTGEHPWKESFWAQLIVALHHSGRSADALDTYQNVRRMFVDELGVEPGPQVQQAHRTVLAGGADGGFAAEPAVREAICQLPADVHSFVGRTGPIEMLNGWFGGARHRAVVISGPPGVGKTALAVHVGHLSRPLFPDGQLYVNLQGYSGESPMTPAAALIRFLGALGVPQNRVPADVEGQAALFRSVLADRKMLVLLDNALDADQVRPLLPGEPGCAVLITSRNDLRGLAVRPGVDHLPLGVLTGEESHAVLTDLLGTERAESELEAVTELARTCAHLPLALRIVGANLAADPHRDVEVYTEELKKRGRLSELAIDGDEPSAVRIAFDQSYLRMRAGDRGLFRLLGLVSGPDIGETAAAALAGVTPYEARRSLDRLAAANLLHRHAPGRYQLHDLIREYAADRARAEDAPGAVTGALARMIDHYLCTAARATQLLYAGRVESAEGVRFTEATALDWLDGERENLMAVMTSVATQPSMRHYAWRLADVLRDYLQARGYAREALAGCAVALRSAAEAGDRAAQTSLLDVLGQLCQNLSDYTAAAEYHRQALSVARELDDRNAEADALRNLGRAFSQAGRLREALGYYRQALAVSRAAGNVEAEIRAMTYIGSAHSFAGEPRVALEWHERALALAEGTGNREVFFRVLNGRGIARWALGELDGAREDHERVLAACRERGLGFGETASLNCLAEIEYNAGHLDRAMAWAQEALRRSSQVGDRRGEATAIENIATIRNLRGEHDAAIAGFLEAQRLAGEIGLRYGETSIRLGLASAYRGLGDAERALAYGEQALATMRESGRLVLEVAALREIARCRLDLGDPVAAAVAADEAVSLAKTRGQALAEARSREVLELVRQAAGGPGGASVLN